MKRMTSSVGWDRTLHKLRKILATGRAFIFLSLCSMLVFLLLGLAGMLQKSIAVSPVQSMKGFAASLSGSFFESLLGMELPHVKPDAGTSPFQAGKLAVFLVRFLTDLNPNDPKSLLAAEMPGMSPDRSILLRSGSGGDDEAPEDRGPLSDDHGDPAGEPAVPDDQPSMDGNPGSAAPDPSPADSPESPPDDQANPPDEVRQSDTGGRKVVFIYHSHNRESWLPELQPGAKEANSDKINVTLVGKRLAKQLEEKGIGAVQSSKDYAATVKAYNWNLSYKYSLQSVRQAMADNRSLQFFFDIHRDSQRRSKTTATIRGISYAQVYFIIGHKNPDWKQNEAFASQIHEKLEKEYPGLSRGIWGKSAANGNGEYNQSVAPNSVLIEIGGVDNTLKECYRTADVLAEAIAELYWESQDAVKTAGEPESH